MAETFNPDEHTVAEVNDYLKDADGTERERVLAAERDGQARKTVDGLHAEGADAPGDTTTKAQTFTEAAGNVDPHDTGRLGVSPEAERTGRRDKGLSQSNPAVLNGGPLPDPRQGVDDSKAIDALKG